MKRLSHFKLNAKHIYRVATSVIFCVTCTLSFSGCQYTQIFTILNRDSEATQNSDNKDLGPVQLAEHVSLQLLPPDSFQASLSMTQKVTFDTVHKTDTKQKENIGQVALEEPADSDSDSKKPRILLSQVEITAEVMRVAMLTPSGLALATLEWNGTTLQVDSRFKKLPFDITYLLADMQLSLWPIDVLNLAITGGQITNSQMEQISHSDDAFSVDSASSQQNSDLDHRYLYRDKDTKPVINIKKFINPKGLPMVKYQHKERGYDITIETLSIQHESTSASSVSKL